jgi:hypothetical protein
MRFRKIEGYLFCLSASGGGMYLTVGLLLGYSIGREKAVAKPNTVVVDIVKEGDEILIYEHYTGKLIFEYNKNKEVDKSAYREFEEVWEETKY